MKRLVLAIMIAVVPSLAASETDPRKTKTSQKLQTLPAQKAVPPASRAASNPCAIYGVGFVRVEGTETCVRMGGSVGAGVGSMR